MNKYYPVGTIVRLTIDADMLFMISGYLTRQNDGQIFDYFAVPFPFGLIKENQYISFNSDCIVDVVYEGYVDENCQGFLNGFDEFLENLKNPASTD